MPVRISTNTGTINADAGNYVTGRAGIDTSNFGIQEAPISYSSGNTVQVNTGYSAPAASSATQSSSSSSKVISGDTSAQQQTSAQKPISYSADQISIAAPSAQASSQAGDLRTTVREEGNRSRGGGGSYDTDYHRTQTEQRADRMAAQSGKVQPAMAGPAPVAGETPFQRHVKNVKGGTATTTGQHIEVAAAQSARAELAQHVPQSGVKARSDYFDEVNGTKGKAYAHGADPIAGDAKAYKNMATNVRKYDEYLYSFTDRDGRTVFATRPYRKRWIYTVGNHPYNGFDRLPFDKEGLAEAKAKWNQKNQPSVQTQQTPQTEANVNDTNGEAGKQGATLAVSDAEAYKNMATNVTKIGKYRYKFTDRDGIEVHANHPYGQGWSYTFDDGDMGRDFWPSYKGFDRLPFDKEGIAEAKEKWDQKQRWERERQIKEQVMAAAQADGDYETTFIPAADGEAFGAAEQSTKFKQQNLGPRGIPSNIYKQMQDASTRAESNEILSKYRRDIYGTSAALDDVFGTEDAFKQAMDDATSGEETLRKKYQKNVGREASRSRAAQRDFIAAFLSGDLSWEGQRYTKDQDGNAWINYDPEIEAGIQTIGKLYGLDPVSDLREIFQIVRLATGLSGDRDVKYFMKNGPDGKHATPGQEPSGEVYSEIFLYGVEAIIASQQTFGHPFGFTRYNANNICGTRPRFPVGVIPKDLAMKITGDNSAIEMSAEELVEAALDTWNSPTGTYHQLVAWTTAHDEGAMLRSYEDIVRATCTYAGYNMEDYGVSPIPFLSKSQLIAENMAFRDTLTNVDPEHAQQVADAELERFNKAAEYKRKWTKSKEGRTNEIVSDALSIWRGFHVMGNVPLMVSAVAEKGKGMGEAYVNAKIDFVGTTADGRSKQIYKLPDRFWRDLTATEADRIIEAVSALELLITVAGGRRDLLLLYSQTDRPMTMDAVQKWINDELPDAKFPKAREFCQKAQKVYEKLMLGDNAAKTMTAKAYTQNLAASIAHNELNITGAELAAALKDNPAGLFSDIAATNEVYQAYHKTFNSTYQRVSPVSVALNSIMAKNGLTDAFVSFLLNAPYLSYSVKVLEAWIPGTNTMEYLAAYGLAKAGVVDKTILEASIGGMEEKFSEGLKTCVRYDLARFGSTAMQALAHLAIISIFGGIEPPDDDDDEEFYNASLRDYRYWKLPNPFTGEKESVMMSWWLDDLTQWSIPVTVGIAAFQKTGDASLAWDIAYGGALDMLGSNKVTAGMESLFGLPQTMQKLRSGEIDGNSLGKTLVLGLEDRVLKFVSDPMALAQFHDALHTGEFERDIWKNNDGSNRNAFQARMQQFALNNDVFGLLAGWAFDGNFGWSATQLRTEYDKYDEQQAEIYGSKNWFAANGNLDPNNPDSWASYYAMLRDLEKDYGNTAEMAAKGVRISKSDAYQVGNWINEQMSKMYDELDNLAINNPSQYYAVKDSIYAKINQMKNFKADLYYDNLIFDKEKYNVVYNDKVNVGNSGIYKDYGNNTLSGDFMPWVSPDKGSTNVNDNNYQEIKFRDIHTDAGYKTEKYTNDGRTSDGRYWVPAEKTSELTDERKAEIAKAGYTSNDYKNLSFADQCAVDSAIMAARKEEIRQNASASGNTRGSSYGSRSYSSGYRSYSGGGGGYQTRVYWNNVGTLSTQRPQQMSTRSPYSANKNYLQPNVKTKGSRDAYQRSEY